MCRALAYLGPSIPLGDLLFEPDSSLVRQSYEPQQLEFLNLGGFGMTAWDKALVGPGTPLEYRSADLPIYDTNLRSMASHLRAGCLLAHVRGIAYRASRGFGEHNLHPFKYRDQRWAMAHNGDLAGHRAMERDLLSDVPADLQQSIDGTTDSELVYAMVLAELRRLGDDGTDALIEAVQRTVERIHLVRAAHGVDTNSALNLFFADGRAIVALRYTFDFGNFPLDAERLPQGALQYLSLWYTVGDAFRDEDGRWAMHGDPRRMGAAIVASEPLTRDVSGWVEVPEYSLIVVEPANSRLETIEVRV